MRLLADLTSQYFFKSSKPPPGAIPPGVWRITRHPN